MNRGGVWSYGHLADTIRAGKGEVRALIDYGDDWCRLPDSGDGTRRLRKVEAVVAAGSPDWPEFVKLDQETEMLPGTGTNVDGGVGFLGGIVTDTVTVMKPNED